MVELVSIITPLYNCEEHIGRTIKSVISQTYVNWEMIIVDDASEDGSLEIAQKFAATDERIKLIALEKNVGGAAARNEAIEIASGRFIAFLDSDDIWYPEKLKVQINFMLGNGSYFTFSSYDRANAEGIHINTMLVRRDISYKELLKSCPIGCLTAVYDSSVIGKIKMPDIRKRQDYCLWLRILKIVPVAHHIPDVLASYTVRTGSISNNKISAAGYQWKVYRNIERLGLLKSVYYFSNYFVKGVIKTYVR